MYSSSAELAPEPKLIVPFIALVGAPTLLLALPLTTLLSEPTLNVPFWILVCPVYVFAPLSVSVPVPAFASPCAPLITPLNVISLAPILLSLPRVTLPLRLAATLLLLFTSAPADEIPVPFRINDSSAIVWPLRSSVAPVATTVLPAVEPSPKALVSFIVPLLIVVIPV